MIGSKESQLVRIVDSRAPPIETLLFRKKKMSRRVSYHAKTVCSNHADVHAQLLCRCGNMREQERVEECAPTGSDA
jgi:hypothetical protein